MSFNHITLVVNETEFEKFVPRLSNSFMIKDKVLSFYQAGTGENLVVLKQEKGDKTLFAYTTKKTGWRPNAKKLVEAMKQSLDDKGELCMLVDMTEHMPVFDFVTGKDLAFFGRKPNRGCNKKEVRNLVINTEVDENGCVITKPFYLLGYTDHLTNIVFFKNYGNTLMYSKEEPTLFGSKIIYRALMEMNGFDPEASVTLALDSFISPYRGSSKVGLFNFDALDDLFKVNITNTEVVIQDKVIDVVPRNVEQFPLLLPGHETDLNDPCYFSEVIDEIIKNKKLENCARTRLDVCMNIPELEKLFPYDLFSLYRSWDKLVLTIDKTKPNGEWINKDFNQIEVRERFKFLLGFEENNSWQLDFYVHDSLNLHRPGIEHIN